MDTVHNRQKWCFFVGHRSHAYRPLAMTSSKSGVGHLGVHDRKSARRCAHSLDGWLVKAWFWQARRTRTFKREVPGEAEATEWERSVRTTSRGMERRCWSMAVHHLYSHGDVFGVLSECIHGRSSHECKRLECYQRFIAGWVREISVLVSVQG